VDLYIDVRAGAAEARGLSGHGGGEVRGAAVLDEVGPVPV